MFQPHRDCYCFLWGAWQGEHLGVIRLWLQTHIEVDICVPEVNILNMDLGLVGDLLSVILDISSVILDTKVQIWLYSSIKQPSFL